ncbi:hypothetical protein J6A31_08915 [bacterium]|nr:hypothetical protein [bacterium]
MSDNSSQWYTVNPSFDVENQPLLVTLCTIINTETGCKHYTKTVPAKIRFKDETAIWSIMDGTDYFEIECNSDNTVINNFKFENDIHSAKNLGIFIRRYDFVIAWMPLPTPYQHSESESTFVIIGRNERTEKPTIIFKHSSVNIIKKVLQRLCLNAKHFEKIPLTDSNNKSFAVYEVYPSNEINNPDKRMYYSDNAFNIQFDYHKKS